MADKVAIVDTAISTGATTSSVAAISASGHEVFATFVGGGTAGPPPSLQPPGPYTESRIYRNDHGTLQVSASLFIDSEYPEVEAGGATPDFRRFVVCDGNAETQKSRIRVFDRSLSTPLSTLIVPGLFVSGQHVAFFDNRYIAVQFNYVQVRVYDLDRNLAQVASFEYPPNTLGINDMSGFSLRQERYLALAANQLTPDDANTIRAELQLYRLVLPSGGVEGTLLLVASAPQPQFAIAVTSLVESKHGREATLAVGTQRATLPAEQRFSTYQGTTPSLLPDDSHELRIYRFRPEEGSAELRLVASGKPDADVTGIGIDPRNPSSLMVITRTTPVHVNNPNNSGTLGMDIGYPSADLAQIYAIGKRKQRCRLGREIAPTGPGIVVSNETYTAQFGCRYLIIAGCKGSQTGPAPPEQVFLGFYKNLRLLRVRRPCSG